MPELERRKKNKIIKKMISSSKDKNTEDERPGPVWKVVKKNVPYCPMCMKEGIKNEMRYAKGDAATMFTWQCSGIRCNYAC